MQRREFVQRLPTVASGVLAGVAGLSLGGCGGVPYVTPRLRPGGVAISASLLEEEGAAFLQSPAMERPIYVRRDRSGQVVALLASCTHRGCQPEPVGDRLVCPCHGSEFSLHGDVLEGPAERSLTRYEVTREGDEVVIWLERRKG